MTRRDATPPTPPEPPEERSPLGRVAFYRALFFATLLLVLATSGLVYLWAMEQISVGEKVAP